MPRDLASWPGPGWREAARALRFSCAARASLRFAPAPSLRLPPTAGGERERQRPRRLGWAPGTATLPRSWTRCRRTRDAERSARPRPGAVAYGAGEHGRRARASLRHASRISQNRPISSLRGANRPPPASCYIHAGAARPIGGRWFLGKIIQLALSCKS